jgi:uncharacterized protein
VAARPVLRLVLDTNIVISGLLWRGVPRDLLWRAAQDSDVMLFTSEIMIEELSNTLGYRKFEARLSGAGLTVDDAILIYRRMTQCVEPPPITGLVPRDPKDDMVAATAIAARAHGLVSGDKDLTTLVEVAGIIVLKADEALALIEERSG